ncbi:uncharacterized protein LOC121242280 [Juglans microcarpa x Juglans regia]|uniref:uncharacterized protein LOC121242280 n=1 Tax=Juglans microcarpa x Juglans regia TaxID=2249226 RepID=UPI001B7DE2C6|nr:uncharacterized protein LOC121242280 [Juglans microcarpa x Juglans regia]
MSDLNANENEREANPSASEVLRAVAHQLIDDLVQNPTSRQRNYEQKVAFATFKLTGEAKRWWISERTIREVEGTEIVSWLHFKQIFLERFFPSSFREDKAMEFATLVQGTMTVHQYAAKFTELSRFATYLIPDEEKKVRKFEQGLNEKLYERVVGFQIQNFSEMVNKATVFERTLQRSTAIHEQRKRTTPTGYHSGMDQGPWKKRNESSSSGKRSVQGNQQPYQCRTCNQVHFGECRKWAGLCFRCGKSGHYIKECPMQLGSNRATILPPPRNEVPARGSNQRPTAPARVFALTPREVEGRNDVITGVTHSFVSMAYSRFCTLETERLKHKLVVVTPTGNSIVCSEILLGCPLSIEGRLMLADLIVFHMIGFDVILGMDWLASYHASIDCSKKEGFLACVVEASKEELMLEQIPVVKDYAEVFPEDLSGLPPEREVEFAIELVPSTTPLSKAPYRMAPSELVELKEQLQDLLDKGFIRPNVSPWELQFSL